MPVNKILLSIVIPTYNRNARLNETLALLLPQLTPVCELLILDNASTIPVSETSAEVLEGYPDVRICRHRTNIGADANICRCVEYATGEFVWVLGDDDHILRDSVRIALESIREFPHVTAINFSTEMCMRSEQTICRGVKDFIGKIDSFANILFISASVLHAERLRSRLRYAYHLIYSMAPLVAALLMTLEEDGVAVLSHRQIIGWGEPGEETHWSTVDQALGRMLLLELPLTTPMRRSLAARIAITPREVVTLAYTLTGRALLSGDPKSSLFVYNQIRQRAGLYSRRLDLKITLMLSRLPVRFPRLGLKWFMLASRLTGLPRRESMEKLLLAIRSSRR